jgi:ParB-like chromosome segregation protein Spo0J
MEIVKVRIEDIIPYENNVKQHPKEQIEQIKKSISELGNNDPIAIDENNVIIEGHGRLIALQELGYKVAECIVIDGLSEEQKNAYRLIHNKLTMNSGFDLRGLEEELNKIKSMDMSQFDFDMKALEAELSKLRDNDREIEEDNFDIDSALEEEPIVKRGEVWRLSNHYLMCADSTSKENVIKLVNADSYDGGCLRCS